MADAETLFETDELEGLEGHFHNLPEESPSIAASEHEMVPQLVEGKETPETPNQTEHQLEQSTTRELVSQELAKSGRGEGVEVGEIRGTYRFNEDSKEWVDENNFSLTKSILEMGNEEDVAMYHEMLQQFGEGGDAIFINKEQPGDEDPDTMHGSYMMLYADGSISYGLTERKIERSEEEEITGREEGEAPVENRWTVSEHTEHEVLQFDGPTEILAQLAAAHETTIAQPNAVDVGSGEEHGEQAAVTDIETLASPTVDSGETITQETAVETGKVFADTVHEPSVTEVVSISEFLHVDPLESLPVFETPEATAHVPEAVVPEVTSPQAPQPLDIRETAMYQAIVAFLKNDTDAIHVSEKPGVEVITEPVQEAADSNFVSESREAVAEDAAVLAIENRADTVHLEAQPQTTEIAQDTGSAEMTTAQTPLTEAPIAVSRVEEKIDIATILPHTDNQIRIAPEVVQEGHERKVDEVENVGSRVENSGHQSVLNAHEILLRALGIREKTLAASQERPYNNTHRAGNPMMQLPGRASTQPRGRTASKFGISLIEM